MTLRSAYFLMAVGALTALPVLPATPEDLDAPATLTHFRAAAAAPDPEGYGTSSDILLTVGAHEFQEWFGTEGPVGGFNGARTCAAGVCAWLAHPHLPAGAAVTALRLEACDGDAGAEFTLALFRAAKPVGTLVPFPGLTTGGPAVPGCATFTVPMSPPHTVDNNTNLYTLDVVTQNPGTNMIWASVTIVYRLQLSPAPAVATFTDVPVGHPLFQFVEALAASGITGGCGGGNFCPNAPLTRGQMAVFLATALGLHFPN